MATIRPATETDLDRLEAIHEASIRELGHTHYSEPEIEAWTASSGGLDSYPVHDPDMEVIVAERDGEIAGLAQLSLADAEIEKVYVHPDFAGQGIGSKLVEHLEAVARQEGIDSLYVESSLNAEAFYRACGYSTFDEHRKKILRAGVSVEMGLVDMERSL